MIMEMSESEQGHARAIQQQQQEVRHVPVDVELRRPSADLLRHVEDQVRQIENSVSHPGRSTTLSELIEFLRPRRYR
jgi:hypothetical protein